MRLTRSFIPALLIASGAVTACARDITTAPRPASFDAPHALARIEPIAAILDQPIFASFEGAERYFETFFRSGLVETRTLTPSMRAGFPFGVTGSLTALSQRLSASTIPADVQGQTFVWNPDTRAYIPDPTAAGAPPLGVRFILYVWGANGPTVPLIRIGYVDIALPEGAESSADQAEVVIERDAPRAIVGDFAVTHRTNAGVNSFSIEGSATDTRTVALIALDGTESGAAGQHQLVFNTNLSSSPAGVSATEQLTSDQAMASQGGRLELKYDGHRFTDETVSAGADLKFDGSLYAHVLFPTTVNGQTRYLRPDGTSLSSQEIADVNALLERTVVASFFWVQLAWP